MIRLRLARILREEGLVVTAAPVIEVVRYKGKSYRMVWSGPTKYGERAKLQFLDGSKEFWVDLKQVDRGRSAPPPPAVSKPTNSRRCRGCGGPVVNAPHHRAMGGYCGSCAFDEYDM